MIDFMTLAVEEYLQIHDLKYSFYKVAGLLITYFSVNMLLIGAKITLLVKIIFICTKI